MAKDPAFLFYSQDFIVGVQTLNFEERGKYITILCQMHQQGRMSEETICFIVGSVSVSLKSKFSIDDNGFWYNKRLEEEIAKRNHYTDSRRKNGLKGGRKKKKSYGLHMANHMGNEDEDEDVNESNKIKETEKQKLELPPKLEIIRETIESWIEYKRENGKKYKSQGLKALLSELEKQNVDRVKENILYSMSQGWAGIHEKKQNYGGGNAKDSGGIKPEPGKYAKFERGQQLIDG